MNIKNYFYNFCLVQFKIPYRHKMTILNYIFSIAKQLSSLIFGKMSLEMNKMEDFPEIHFNETELQTLNDDFSDEDAFTVQPSTNKLNNVYSTTDSTSKSSDNAKYNKIQSFIENKENIDNSRFIRDGMSVENFVKGSSNSLQGIEKFRSNKSSFINDLADTQGTLSIIKNCLYM